MWGGEGVVVEVFEGGIQISPFVGEWIYFEILPNANYQ